PVRTRLRLTELVPRFSPASAVLFADRLCLFHSPDRSRQRVAPDAERRLSSRRCKTKLRCARGPAFYQKGTSNHFQARAFPAGPKRSWSFRWCVGQAAFPPAHAVRVSASRLPIRLTARACHD